MPEKSANLAGVLGAKTPIVHSWFKILIMCVFLGILVVWGIDWMDMRTFQKDFVVLKLNNSAEALPFIDSNFRNLSAEPNLERDEPNQIDFNLTNQILAQTHENHDPKPPNSVENRARNVSISNSSSLGWISSELEANSSSLGWISAELEAISSSLGRSSAESEANSSSLGWISAELESNYSSNLLEKWLAPGGQPCMDSKTVEVTLPKLDGNKNIELATGEIHEFVFRAIDESGEPHCLGGDYFELDLSSEKWKSRPPIRDFGNGTYSFSLQVHPDFAGYFNLTIILLFRHYEGLKFSPIRFAFDRVLRVVPIKFVTSSSSLPDLRRCKNTDYTKDVWSGRWTRHARNDSCSISRDGRYRCQAANFPCQHPWCDGPLGSIESNGWVYSAHCSFKFLSSDEAWKCLNNRWIFWWGDSNHCDTVRNILHFILGVDEIATVPRLFDMNITNPKNPSQTVRFTSIFNGHWNHTGNYQGLNSLTDEEYRNSLRRYFSGRAVPDTVIMNSGLHDGIFWSNIRKFIKGADYAAKFWADVMEGVRANGLSRPVIIYRTTITTGGYARSMGFNPSKMEAFNGVVLDKLRKYGILDRVIDDFDMTYPWHYDNRCNDGVHYGRAPLKARWRDGQIGHQYFVDLMLCHVLINALCTGPE